MKTIGIFILASCPIIFALSNSISLNLNKKLLEKIVQLINWFIYEIKFCQTSLNELINNCCQQSFFKSLTFLTDVQEKMEFMAFPKAWETSIDKWQTVLNKHDVLNLKSLSNVLGAFDCDSQIAALKRICLQFEESLQNIKKTSETKSKLSKSLGLLTSLAIYVVLI